MPIITLATALYAAGYFVWERSGWGSPDLRDLISNVAFMPLNLSVIALYGLGSRHSTLDPGVRRALGLMAIAFLMVFSGNAISTYYVLALHTSPPVSWADPFYLSNYLFILFALLSFPLAKRTPLEWWKFALDAAVVLVGGGVVIWYFIVRPTETSGHGDLVVLALAFAYPLGSLLVLLGIITVLLRRPIDGNRRAFGLLVSGSLVSIVADLVFGLILVDTGHRGAAWTDAVYLLTYLLLIAGGEQYYRQPVARMQRTSEEDSTAQDISPLPYLAIAITYGLLLYVGLDRWIDPLSGLAVGAVLMTVIVVARQFIVVRQNVQLLAETAVRRSEARFRSLVQHSSDVIFVVHPDTSIRFVSPSVSRVFGHHTSQITNARLAEFIHPEDLPGARAFFSEAARNPGVTPPVEWRVRRPDGSWLYAETIGTNLLEDPTVAGLVLNTRDVSERRRLEQQLTHQAFHDPLTGLANRALFRDRISHALTLSRRQGHTLAVIFLDLDDFKKVNDSLGHTEGDRLLVMAAQRLLSCARASDTVARMGGDEFAILVEDITAPNGCGEVVQRLTEAMQQQFRLDSHEVAVSASMGIASPAGDETADDLLRNADVAMYTAKRKGKGRHETYDAGMYADIMDRLETEASLRRAIHGGELTVYYQPIVALASNRIVGLEALVRWRHPRLGELVPLHFIPLAEETGLIAPLGQWVVREAFGQLKRWGREYPTVPLSIYVNISGRQLHEPDMVEQILAALRQEGLDPHTVVLEITESVLMQQTEAVLARLQGLKVLGVQLAIDDFGTGYSSLSYLQRFPIDILKIAKPFVDDVAAGAGRAALARAIVGLGDTLKLRTIAEGIEIAEQRASLLELGCQFGQGFYFAPPLPASAVEAILKDPTVAVQQNRSSGGDQATVQAARKA